MTRPQTTEAADYYFRYIDLITSDDIVPALRNQTSEMLQLLSGISEEQSLYSYAPGKWTIREVLNHVNDGERIFASRLRTYPARLLRRIGHILPRALVERDVRPSNHHRDS